MRILLVDDDAAGLRILAEVIEDLGHQPVPCPDAEKALELCRREPPPLVITDVRMPGMDGLTLLGRLKADGATRGTDVILLTGHGDLPLAIEALRKGAYDFLTKPVDARTLAAAIERCAERRALLAENQALAQDVGGKVREATDGMRRELNEARELLRRRCGLEALVAASPAMRTVLEEARIYHGDPSLAVLIEGETGTGKELVARLVHFGDGGTDTPFVDLNCSALPGELFESELFGYEPGAFTGGRAGGAPGKLGLAGDGSLFLDEIGDLPPALQPKLLRVLESRAYYRVGGVKKRDFRARVIAATNQDLGALVRDGRFRADLYHRLRVGHLRLPPLRERPEEIEPLATLFLARETRRKKKNFAAIAPDALDLLRRHDWPGNIRELENAIERAVLMHDGEQLLAAHLTAVPEGPTSAGAGPTAPEDLSLPEAGLDLEALNHDLVLKALAKFGGNKSKAAEYLGLSRGAFRNRLAQAEKGTE